MRALSVTREFGDERQRDPWTDRTYRTNTVVEINEAIRAALQNALGCTVGPCGEDPISGMATPVFDEKFAAIIDRHMAHRAELEQAVTSLRAVASSYRIDEAAIERSFRI